MNNRPPPLKRGKEYRQLDFHPLDLSSKNQRYKIFHHNGAYSEVGEGVFLRHLSDHNVVRTANKRGVVRAGLICYEDGETGQLRFFAGNQCPSQPVPGSWEQVVRAWLQKPPFPAETHFKELRDQGMGRMEAFMYLEQNGYLTS